LLFWISPILWSFMDVAGRGARLQTGLASISEGFGLPTDTLFNIISMNPTSVLMESYRKVLYGGLDHNKAGDLIWKNARPAELESLFIIFVIGVILAIIGVLIFTRLEPAFAKVL